MAVTLPKINITFKQLATSFIQRSERGVAVLIVRDATAGGNGYATYTDITESANPGPRRHPPGSHRRSRHQRQPPPPVPWRDMRRHRNRGPFQCG